MGLIRDVCLAAWEAVILPPPSPRGWWVVVGQGVEKLEKGDVVCCFCKRNARHSKSEPIKDCEQP